MDSRYIFVAVGFYRFFYNSRRYRINFTIWYNLRFFEFNIPMILLKTVFVSYTWSYMKIVTRIYRAFDRIYITEYKFTLFVFLSQYNPKMINVDLMSTFEIKNRIDKKDMSSCLGKSKYLRNWTFLFNSCSR